MYASVRTSPERQSWMTHATRPCSSKATSAGSSMQRILVSEGMLARVAAALAVLALGAAMGAIGLPSSYLFAALVVGVGFALVRPGAVSVPGWGFTAGQAVTGVVLGAYLRSSTLSAVASDWLPVTLVSLGTLAVTTLCGIVLARVAPVDRPTASLGMIAGGASGIVGMADELGADDRLVAFMQYLRVLVVVVLTPIIVAVAWHPGAHASASSSPGSAPLIGGIADWGWTLAAI